jgi:hypothetical protein
MYHNPTSCTCFLQLISLGPPEVCIAGFANQLYCWLPMAYSTLGSRRIGRRKQYTVLSRYWCVTSVRPSSCYLRVLSSEGSGRFKSHRVQRLAACRRRLIYPVLAGWRHSVKPKNACHQKQSNASGVGKPVHCLRAVALLLLPTYDTFGGNAHLSILRRSWACSPESAAAIAAADGTNSGSSA